MGGAIIGVGGKEVQLGIKKLQGYIIQHGEYSQYFIKFYKANILYKYKCSTTFKNCESLFCSRASLVAQMVKNLPAMQETCV